MGACSRRSWVLTWLRSVVLCRNISAVPIVDEEGRVIDLYHRFDVTFIALAGDAEQTMSNLNMRLSDLLGERRGERVEGGGCSHVRAACWLAGQLALLPRLAVAVWQGKAAADSASCICIGV